MNMIQHPAWPKTEKRSFNLINDRLSLQAGIKPPENKINKNHIWFLTQNLRRIKVFDLVAYIYVL